MRTRSMVRVKPLKLFRRSSRFETAQSKREICGSTFLLLLFSLFNLAGTRSGFRAHPEFSRVLKRPKLLMSRSNVPKVPYNLCPFRQPITSLTNYSIQVNKLDFRTTLTKTKLIKILITSKLNNLKFYRTFIFIFVIYIYIYVTIFQINDN